jgi:hypothetical protein
MKAIVEVEFTKYLISDSKKALLVTQILNASQRVRETGYHAYELLDESPSVSMKTLTNQDRMIIKPKAKK